MDISKCETCAEVCPQAQGRREAAVGRMYAMRELAKCAPYWDALFDENEKPKITPDRLRELVEADRDGRCVVLPVKEGDTVYHVSINPFEDYPPEIFEFPFHITDYYNIGNTVFLTEEAAEAALKGDRHG